MAGCSGCSSNKGNQIIDNKFTTHEANKISKVIGIMSGKGGVGKSTITTLLAKDLAKKGYKVGIMDADITGPSIPRLMGVRDEKATSNGTDIFPVITKEGIEIISLNLLLATESEPVVWRGSIISQAVRQFWQDVIWGELDYLLIDMPPGTGDVALTVMQSLPINGIVMVSIPQDMVSMIVAKAVNMARKLNIPVLGVVENMSYIECPDCSKKISFNEDSSHEFLEELKLPLLGELPMTMGIAHLTRGEESEDTKLFEPIANNIEKEINKL